MEFIKSEQPVARITQKNIDGNNISTIKLNQKANGGKYGIIDTQIAPTSNDSTGIELNSDNKEIMFGNYYKIIKVNRNCITVECKSCKSILKDSMVKCLNTHNHMKNQHADLYEKYKEDFRQYKLRNIEPADGNSIDLRANYKRILFEKYFDLLSTKGKRMQALCRICNATLKFGSCCSSLLSHLRTQHPNDYTNHQVAVKQGRYDVSDGNEIEVEFKEEFKRILFKNYYKVISKDEVKGLTAACRSCGRIQHSTQKGTLTFRTHLKESHPDVYKYYKEEVEETKRYQSDLNDTEEIKLEFRSYAQQMLYDKHLRLIEINGKKARVVCRHCELVLIGFLSNTSGFRKHLRTRHPKINEDFLKDIESYKSKNSGSVNIPKRKRSFSINDKVKPKPKLERMPNEPNESDNDVSTGFVSNTSGFQKHEIKHAESHGKYLADIKHYKKGKSYAAIKTGVNIDKKRSKLVDNKVEPRPKCRKNSKTPNDKRIPPASIQSENIDAPTDLLIDKIKKEPVVEEIDMSELLTVKIEQGPSSGWQHLGVEIVREEAGPDEFIKEEPQFYDEYETLDD